MLRALVRLGLLALVIAGALQLGRDLAGNDPPPEDSADVGFARDMRVHHAQAVEMADLVRDRTSDEDLRVVAADISHTQTAQIGQMRGWLDAWDLAPTTTDPPMTWAHDAAGASDDGDDAEMPGLASDEEIRRLESSSAQEAEVLFLQLMIRHHEGGVHMASMATELVDEEEVLALARTIGESQLAEIRYLTALLQAREAEALPSLLPPDLAGLGGVARSDDRGAEARDLLTRWWLVGLGGLALLLLAWDLLRRPRRIPVTSEPIATVATASDEHTDEDDRDDDTVEKPDRDDDLDRWLRDI